MSGLSENDTPASGDAVDHLRRPLKSLGPTAVMPGLKPATPVKNKRTFVVQSINGTLIMIAKAAGETNQPEPKCASWRWR
ncbi:hypothetical protein MRX96_016988 [Rhipicephalus microplus]